TPGPNGLELKAGDIFSFRIRNPNPFRVDVTLLMVDSRFKIDPYFPEPDTTVGNRLPPNQTEWVKTPRLRVKPEQGIDHLVVIAVKGKGDPFDFSGLAQSGV